MALPICKDGFSWFLKYQLMVRRHYWGLEQRAWEDRVES